MCASLGGRPREIASNITSFGDFARGHGDEIRALGLEDAAAIFLGNVLIASRNDTFWVRYGEGFPSPGNRRRQYEVLPLLDLLITSDESTYRTCAGMIEEWART